MADDELKPENEEQADPQEVGEKDNADADADAPDLDGDFDEAFADAEFAEEGEEDGDDDDDADDEAGPAGSDKAAEEDDDDEPDPDDVEEDLDVILKDRLASGDDLEEDEEDEEDEVVAPPITATEADDVAPKREGEWTCTGCFLIVSARQFGKRETATCPSGVGACPSLEML